MVVVPDALKTLALTTDPALVKKDTKGNPVMMPVSLMLFAVNDPMFDAVLIKLPPVIVSTEARDTPSEPAVTVAT